MEIYDDNIVKRLEKYQDKINSINKEEKEDFIIWLIFNKNDDPDFRIEIKHKNKPEDFKVGQIYRYRDDNFKLKTIEITFIRSSVLFYKVIDIEGKHIISKGKEEIMFDSSLRAELLEPEEMDFDMNPKYYKPSLKFNKTKINCTYGKKYIQKRR